MSSAVSSKSKRIGTGFETSVARFFTGSGIPARRVALAGSDDEGDVRTDDYRLLVECKAGKAAEGASHALIVEWLGETERERVNADAPYAVLVRKTAGKGVAQAHLWAAHMTSEQFGLLTGATLPSGIVMSMTLGDFLALWRMDNPDLFL